MAQTKSGLPPEVAQSLMDLEASLKSRYPGGVPRNKIGIATGHVLHPLTCRNEDSLGKGIPGRYKIGRNVVYPIPGIIGKIREKLVMD
jgi:hypothetical protein